MRNIEQLKKCARFYPKGSIIPQRVLSVRPRKMRHLVRFAGDAWVFGVNSRGDMVVAVDVKGGNSVIAWPRLRTRFKAIGSTYSNGTAIFVGNLVLDDDEWAESIERQLER